MVLFLYSLEFLECGSRVKVFVLYIFSKELVMAASLNDGDENTSEGRVFTLEGIIMCVGSTIWVIVVAWLYNKFGSAPL